MFLLFVKVGYKYNKVSIMGNKINWIKFKFIIFCIFIIVKLIYGSFFKFVNIKIIIFFNLDVSMLVVVIFFLVEINFVVNGLFDVCWMWVI